MPRSPLVKGVKSAHTTSTELEEVGNVSLFQSLVLFLRRFVRFTSFFCSLRLHTQTSSFAPVGVIPPPSTPSCNSSRFLASAFLRPSHCSAALSRAQRPLSGYGLRSGLSLRGDTAVRTPPSGRCSRRM
uniref:Uncharacterized protein n=1 Tax=Knipowitschia caucasica TaxID=637954 RepID=A0AAV2JNM0_KNICA